MTADSTAQRVDKLTLARQATSRAKTAQALAAVHRLHAAGDPVTFARVARTAAVSTWFTYNNDQVAAAVRAAQADQAEHGLSETPRPADRVTAASLRVDLEHARHENRALRGQIVQLRDALGRQLGAELEATSPADLLSRVRDLEHHNVQLAQRLVTSDGQRRDLEDQLVLTRADLAAARETLRRAIRAVPPP